MIILSFQSFEMQISKEMVFSLPRKKIFQFRKTPHSGPTMRMREKINFPEKLWFWYFDVALNTFGSGAVKQSQSCPKGHPKAGKGWWGGGRGAFQNSTDSLGANHDFSLIFLSRYNEYRMMYAIVWLTNLW